MIDLFIFAPNSYGGGGAGFQPGFGRANFGGTGGSSFYDLSDGLFPAFSSDTDANKKANPSVLLSTTRSARSVQNRDNKNEIGDALEQLSRVHRQQTSMMIFQDAEKKKRTRDALSALNQAHHSSKVSKGEVAHHKNLDWPPSSDGFVLIVPQVENCCDGRFPCLVLNGEFGRQSVDTICVCGWMQFERNTCYGKGMCKFVEREMFSNHTLTRLICFAALIVILIITLLILGFLCSLLGFVYFCKF